MANPYVGEIRIFGFNFAPVGWATCAGQIMSIAQNTALFSLLGTQYGGDGVQNFALPNLQGRVPNGMGQGLGLQNYVMGQTGGVESVTLTAQQLAAHNHNVAVSDAAPAGTTRPAGAYLGRTTTNSYTTAQPGGDVLGTASIANSGGNQPHENRPPFLTLNYCIALLGIFPARS